MRPLFVRDEQGLGCESNHIRTRAKACVCGPAMWPPPPPRKKESGPSRKPNGKNDRVNLDTEPARKQTTIHQDAKRNHQASSVVHGKGLVSSADLKIRRDSFPSGEVRKPLAGFSPSVIIDTCLRENCIGWSTPLGKRRRKDRQAPTQPAMSGLQ